LLLLFVSSLLVFIIPFFVSGVPANLMPYIFHIVSIYLFGFHKDCIMMERVILDILH
jgi:hypothetical protein